MVAELPLENWKDLIDVIESNESESSGFGRFSGGFVYRGVALHSHDLRPSLLRALDGHDLGEAETLEFEKAAEEEFRSSAHRHLPPEEFAIAGGAPGLSARHFSEVTPTLTWWTLMQHHGAPTRLLDWSESIFVAAYFAAIGQPKEDGAIWSINPNTIYSSFNNTSLDVSKFKDYREVVRARREDFLSPGGPPTLFWFNRPSRTDRMAAQQGLFSVSPYVLADHAEVLDRAMGIPGSPESHCRKLIIPAGQKTTFLRRLRAMNIHANTLFPGLDGLGRSVSEFLRAGGRRDRPPSGPTASGDGASP